MPSCFIIFLINIQTSGIRLKCIYSENGVQMSRMTANFEEEEAFCSRSPTRSLMVVGKGKELQFLEIPTMIALNLA